MDSSGEMPSGFKEVNHSEKTLTIDPQEAPWFDKETKVPLVKITTVGGKDFYLGSAITEKRLVQSAEQLDTRRSEITNNLLYSHLPEFIEKGHHPYIRMVDKARSERPIYYTGNKSGQRVYFMRFNNLDGIPVIIRTAVCDKNTEGVVLGVLTNNSIRNIKATSKL